MFKKFLCLGLLLCLPLTVIAQTPEDTCKEAKDYWSEALEACFVVNDMDADEYFLNAEISRLTFNKARLLQEQQEYNAGNQATRDGNFAARIASLETKRDASAEEVVKDTYQEKIDQLTSRRDFHASVDVSGHGALISDLTNKISKLSEELDIILQQ